MGKEWIGIAGGNALAFVGAIIATIKAEDFSAWGCAAVGIVVAIISGFSVVLKNKALRREAEARAEVERYKADAARLDLIRQYRRLCDWCLSQKNPIKKCGNKFPPEGCKRSKE